MDEPHLVIRDGTIFIENDEIIEVSKSADSKIKRKADIEIDAKNNLVLPGFISTHLHAESAFGRGLGVDAKDLIEWSKGPPAYPMRAYIEPEDAYYASLLSSICALKAGITTVLCSYDGVRKARRQNFDECIRAITESNLRAGVAKLFHSKAASATDYKGDVSEPFLESDSEIMTEYERHFKKWHRSRNGLLDIWMGPSVTGTCTPELFQKINELAIKHDTGITSHIACYKEMVVSFKKQFGKSEIEFLNELGVLSPRFGCIHCIVVTEKDIEILAKTQAPVSHNPTANMFTSQGIAPTPQMLKKGVVVSLATDGPHCNNRIDIIESMKDAALIQKGISTCGTIFGNSAYTVLKMATVGGAQFMRKPNLGKLKQHFKADVIIVDRHTPQFVPSIDPIAGLVYSSSADDVQTVIVNGRLLMENRRLLYLNENTVLEKSEERAANLIGRMRDSGMHIPAYEYNQ